VGGYADAAGNAEGVIATLSDGSWTMVTAPAPASTHRVQLRAVTCPAAGWCVAVGYYDDPSGTQRPLVDTLSGGTWTASTVATSGLDPAASSWATLQAVSCPVAGSCAATGQYQASGAREALVATLAGGTWTAVTASLAGLSPAPASNPGGMLRSVSCPEAGSCVAVGSYLDSAGHEDGLIESLAGGTWTSLVAPVAGLKPAPAIRAGDIVWLMSVSCPAPGTCVAVGQYNDVNNGRDGFAETLSGGSWSATTMPVTGLLPRAQFVNSLTGLSCAAAGPCVAIGTYQDVSGFEHGVLATLGGGAWKPVTAPVTGLDPPVIYTADVTQPPYQVPVTVSSVSCPASNWCVAAGSYADPGKSLHGLIETLSTAPVPSPGYRVATRGGNVYSFNSPAYPAVAASKVAGIAADGPGYLLATSTGQVTSVNAPSFGSFTGTLPAPVTGIAASPQTWGYWLTTSKGNVYNFGAPFFGSKAGKTLPAPVVGIAADPVTGGYWLTTSKGNVYSFHAPFYGSKAGHTLPAPVVGITADPVTGGYWLTTSKGNVYQFNAPFYGSKAGHTLPAPVVGITADPVTGGYWLTTSKGNVYQFHAPFYGSMAGKTLPAPVIGLTPAG
jgi:hypothetical protein